MFFLLERHFQRFDDFPLPLRHHRGSRLSLPFFSSGKGALLSLPSAGSKVWGSRISPLLSYNCRTPSPSSLFPSLLPSLVTGWEDPFPFLPCAKGRLQSEASFLFSEKQECELFSSTEEYSGKISVFSFFPGKTALFPTLPLFLPTPGNMVSECLFFFSPPRDGIMTERTVIKIPGFLFFFHCSSPFSRRAFFFSFPPPPDKKEALTNPFPPSEERIMRVPFLPESNVPCFFLHPLHETIPQPASSFLPSTIDPFPPRFFFFSDVASASLAFFFVLVGGDVFGSFPPLFPPFLLR